MRAEVVNLPRAQPRHEHVPVVVRAVGRRAEADHPSRLRVVNAVEQEQIDPGCPLREHAEVDAAGGDAGAEWGGLYRCARQVPRVAAVTAELFEDGPDFIGSQPTLRWRESPTS